MYKQTLTITGCITTVIYLYILSCSRVEGKSLDLDTTSSLSSTSGKHFLDEILKKISSGGLESIHLKFSSFGDGTDCSPDCDVLSKDFSQPYHNKGSNYYVSKALSTTDMAAVDVCKSICGNIVEVDDNVELNFMQTIMDTANISGILIAGTDKAKEGTWVYQGTGKTMTFTAWGYGEPNKFEGQEHCIMMVNGFSLMYDVPCQLGFFKLNFVCEVK